MDSVIGWALELMQWLVHVTDRLGYLGILLMVLVESTLVPLPIEATLIPAGYLIYQGKMQFLPALAVSVAGTMAGSCVNYWIARKLGRSLILRYGRYVRMDSEKLTKLERFFVDHGAISILTGRLIPGLRHCIALPAGLARMPMPKFLFYTALGSGIVSAMLLAIGYLIGASEGSIKHYVPLIKATLPLLALLALAFYVLRHRRKRRMHKKQSFPLI